MAKLSKATKGKLPERNKTSNKQRVRHYTFVVHVDFEMQYTFTGAKVQRHEEGGPSDFEPTDKALADLQNEIQEYIGGYYPVDKLEVFANSDLLLGIVDEPGERQLLFSRAKRHPKEKVRHNVPGR